MPGDKKERIFSVLTVIFIVLSAVCIWITVTTFFGYREGNAAYAELSGAVEAAAPVSSGETGPEQEQAEIPITIDWDTILAAYPEIVAWLYCENTVINYPVVQTDDNEYYLQHLYDGSYNSNGTLFVDCANTPDFSDDNTIIYGHNMKSGRMFASLLQYSSQDYYSEHPVMYLLTPETGYRMELFSGYTTGTDSPAYILSCAGASDYTAWIGELMERSDFVPEISKIAESDRIVTLSTCSYVFSDARYVLHGRLEQCG